MPTKATKQRAQKKLRQGKRPSTAAGEFVREEIEHVRRGKHGARSTKQAIAIGLSKARRAGVPLAAPKKGQTSERTRRSAQRDVAAGRKKRSTRPRSRKRSAASSSALRREPRRAATKKALSRQAKQAASRRRRQRTDAKSGRRTRPSGSVSIT